VILLRPAQPADLSAIERLLTAGALPTAGVSEHLAGFLVAEEAGRVVGAAGVEVYGGAALLRSVVVDPGHRGRGLAGRLVRGLLERLAREQVDQVFLLTTGAAGYFRRHGFAPIARDALPEALGASRELQDAACRTAQAMTLRLTRASEGGAR
jgi:amino-acid N-acetyltransferase